MKKVLIYFKLGIFAAGIFLLYSQCLIADEAGSQGGSEPAPAAGSPNPVQTPKPKASKFIYVCPMDGYTSDKPGQCPRCGMDLEKQKRKAAVPPKTSAKAKSRMDMSGGMFQSFDVAKFGVGKNAKICPVSGDKIDPGEGVEADLSNGKKIMMCCPDCKDTVVKNLKKYESLMYD